jgi:hypothetical protein
MKNLNLSRPVLLLSLVFVLIVGALFSQGLQFNPAQVSRVQTGTDFEPLILAGTSGQYYRGDKTWQTLPVVAALSFNNAPARSIVATAAAANGFQVSSTRNASVSYSSTISTTATIGGAASGYLLLEICATNSATAGDWTAISRSTNGQTVTLAIALQSVQVTGGCVHGIVPAGYYARIRSVNVSGTPSYTANEQQEVLL